MKKTIAICIVAFSVLASGWLLYRSNINYFGLSSHQISMEIGEALFLNHCETCHSRMKGRNLLMERIRSSQNGFSELQKFVRNHDSLLQAGDPYTLELEKKWGEQIYRHNFTLTDAELKALFYYLETTF